MTPDGDAEAVEGKGALTVSSGASYRDFWRTQARLGTVPDYSPPWVFRNAVQETLRFVRDCARKKRPHCGSSRMRRIRPIRE
jgi:hypothetical protein